MVCAKEFVSDAPNASDTSDTFDASEINVIPGTVTFLDDDPLSSSSIRSPSMPLPAMQKYLRNAPQDLQITIVLSCGSAVCFDKKMTPG